MPCMSASGEHQAAVDEEDPPGVAAALLDRHAVAADLPETRRGRRAVPDQARAATNLVVDLGGTPGEPVGVGAHRRPAGPGGLAEVAQHRLRRAGVGRLVAGLERPALEQPGVDGAGAAACRRPPSGRTARRPRARTSGWRRRSARRRRRRAAAGSTRRRRCRPRSRPVRGDQRGPSRRVAGGVLQPDDVRHVVRQARPARRWRSCVRCGSGCRRSARAGRWLGDARRWASMPACDGRL